MELMIKKKDVEEMKEIIRQIKQSNNVGIQNNNKKKIIDNNNNIIIDNNNKYSDSVTMTQTKYTIHVTDMQNTTTNTNTSTIAPTLLQ